MTTPITRYVRYSAKGKACYGILDGETIRELKGNFIQKVVPTGATVPLSEVRLLAPCEPSKVIAVGRNYQTHLGDRTPLVEPGVFIKLDRKSTRLNSSHSAKSRMPSSA